MKAKTPKPTNAATMCRSRGWRPGDTIQSKQWRGPMTITAIGQDFILAVPTGKGECLVRHIPGDAWVDLTEGGES